MHRRIPLYAAVVGALLVGGATTGGTQATWVDQGSLAASTVSSATMGIAASATPTSLSVDRGSSASVRVTVDDTSSTAARNLKQRVTPALSGSLPTGVTASLTTATPTGCGTTAQGAVDLTPGGSFTTCVTVSTTSSSTATSATVNLAVSGAQVRGTTVGGWTTPTQTVSVPVTISTPTPDAPDLSCSGSTSANGTWYTLVTWSEVANASSYRVYRSTTSASSGYSAVLNTSQRRAVVQMDPGDSFWFRVTTVTNGVESATSNVLRLRRSGSSAPTCQDLG